MRWVFWSSGVSIGYTYIGYMAWLWIRAQLRPWAGTAWIFRCIGFGGDGRTQRGASPREEAFNLLELDYPTGIGKLWWFRMVPRIGRRRFFGICRSSARARGHESALERKACGLNDAMAVAEGEIVVFSDARQEIEPGAVRLLLDNFCGRIGRGGERRTYAGRLQYRRSGARNGLYWKIEKTIANWNRLLVRRSELRSFVCSASEIYCPSPAANDPGRCLPAYRGSKTGGARDL